MPQIKDSAKTTLADHSISLQVAQQNFKTLNSADARAHLTMLAQMLRLMFQTITKKLPKDGGNNIDYLNYLKKLIATIEVIVTKHQLEAARPNSDVQLSCTIDPTDSGFPIAVRDFTFLNNDKQQAVEQLERLPGDEKLVEDALYLIFRGLFPKDVVQQKLARNYYDTLSRLELPQTLQIHPYTHIKQDEAMNFCTVSFERLDEHHNLPRFYTLYLRIPSKSYLREEWQIELEEAIRTGISTVSNLELTTLAEKIEAIFGVQLEYLERFDVGPFYSKYTENGAAVTSLIEADDDCLMMFSKASVVRMGEEGHAGLKDKFLGWRTGDENVGQFSPAINSPQYILMPHRLIQKVHNLNITLKDHTKMFGVTSKGEIYE